VPNVFLVKLLTFVYSIGHVKYGRILLTLQCIHSLLLDNTYATKRELFYKYVNDYGCQAHLDEAVSIISVMLQIPRHKVSILIDNFKIEIKQFLKLYSTANTLPFHISII
jgi:DNA topoisomerase VI subunit A